MSSQNQNPKSQNPKKAKGIFEVVNLGTPAIPTAITNLKRVSTPYIPFGDNNDFPENIAALSRESATLGAVLASKGDFAGGDGYECNNNISVESWLKKVNKEQNIIECVEPIFIDFYLSGNAYIRICRPVNSTILGEYAIFHLPQHKLRLSKELNSYYYNDDWTNRNSLGEPIAAFPMFSPCGVEGLYEESIIHMKDYVPSFDFYGLPTYMGAVQYAKLEYLIGLYNNNQFDNQMLPSGILEVVTTNMEEADAKRFVEGVKSKFVGVEKGNNGKILVMAKDGQESQAKFTAISQEQEGSFKELKSISTDTIITACQWFPSLAGIATEGKLGSNQQIAQEFEVAVRHVSKLQNKFIQCLTRIVNLTKAGAFEFRFLNRKPGNVSKLTEKVNADQIVAFRDLLTAAIAEVDPVKKRAITNAFVILFGFSENEAQSMIYGTNIISN